MNAIGAKRQQSPSSVLLLIPAEIRLQIYHHLFANRTLTANALHYPEYDNEKSSGNISLQPQSKLINILLTCRLIHDEAIIAFYELVDFRFQRHSIDEINWSLTEVRAAFPSFKPSPLQSGLGSTRELVRRISYAGNDPVLIRNIGGLFPKLSLFEFDLDWDHLGSDQTNFDRAMKYAIRNREWRQAIKDALEQRFPDGMVHAVFELQKTSRAERGFQVLLHWRLGYRFIEFAGECDLDEWILRVHDPEGSSKNIYDFRQDPLFSEMG